MDARRCGDVLETIRGDPDVPWWGYLPDDDLCVRLFAESYRYVTSVHEGRVPVVEGVDGRAWDVEELEEFTVAGSNGRER